MGQAERRIVIKSILQTLIFATIVEGFNISNRLAIEETARVLKALLPETLSIRYHDAEDGQEVEVILKKVLNTIPSSLLPIFDIEGFEDEPREPRLNNFLAICYHGVTTYSAITYFPHTETLHGVIDYRYYIEDLPRIHSEEPDVVDSFMHPMEGNDVHLEILPAQHRERRMVRGHSMRDDPIHLSRKKYKETLYAEVLLIIDTKDRADHENPQAPHEKALMYALAYWNAVDMLFSHLKRTQIKINIAGIGVGWTTEVARNIFNRRHLRDPPRMRMENHEVLNAVGKYLHDFRIAAPRPSYDYLIWMTQLSLYTQAGRIRGGPDIGISSPPRDCGGRREEEEEQYGVANHAVVMHDGKYSNYHTAARQLASLMFVSIDDLRRPDSLSAGPSRGIMDPSNLRVEGCLRWSYQSELDFFNYARSKSSCCLRNYPYRTMEMPSAPLPKLTVGDQCQCYKMQPDESVNHDEHICKKWLHCKNHNNALIEVAKILDGTQCQRVNGPGICRATHCVSP